MVTDARRMRHRRFSTCWFLTFLIGLWLAVHISINNHSNSNIPTSWWICQFYWTLGKRDFKNYRSKVSIVYVRPKFSVVMISHHSSFQQRSTCYIEESGAWYDYKTKEEMVNLLLFRELQYSVDSFGLTGLDKLLSFMIVKELQVCVNEIHFIYMHYLLPVGNSICSLKICFSDVCENSSQLSQERSSGSWRPWKSCFPFNAR